MKKRGPQSNLATDILRYQVYYWRSAGWSKTQIIEAMKVLGVYKSESRLAAMYRQAKKKIADDPAWPFHLAERLAASMTPDEWARMLEQSQKDNLDVCNRMIESVEDHLRREPRRAKLPWAVELALRPKENIQ